MRRYAVVVQGGAFLYPAAMKMIRRSLWLCFPAIVFARSAWAKEQVYVQPLGEVKPEVVERVVHAVGRVFAVKAEAAPAIPLPADAYYAPRKRYRADKLLDFLCFLDIALKGRVIGIAEKDISATKGDVYDWGIFGYGMAPGNACVVSVFRLRHGRASGELFLRRLERVALHELGHTFGLLHCDAPGCLMNDARGRIATVDDSNGLFCAACRKKLGPLLK